MKLWWSLTLLFLTSCAVQSSPNSCLLKGYSTPCQGRVRFESPDSKDATTMIEVPAGPTNISVFAESEAEPSEQYPSDPEYSCSNLTRHSVSFTCEPGNSYRMWLSAEGGKDYSIYVLKQIPEDLVNTTRVQSASNQVELKTRCGFRNC